MGYAQLVRVKVEFDFPIAGPCNVGVKLLEGGHALRDDIENLQTTPGSLEAHQAIQVPDLIDLASEGMQTMKGEEFGAQHAEFI